MSREYHHIKEYKKTLELREQGSHHAANVKTREPI